jgi:hypothetical protein
MDFLCASSGVSFLPARDPSPGARSETLRRHMKFVLVNGRTPRPQSFCAVCCKPIGESYLRELTTRLSYCDDKCYAGNCKVAAMITTDALKYLPQMEKMS